MELVKPRKTSECLELSGGFEFAASGRKFAQCSSTGISTVNAEGCDMWLDVDAWKRNEMTFVRFVET